MGGVFGVGKKQKIAPLPKAAPQVTPEDPGVKDAGDAERRRLAALQGRTKTVTSTRNTSGMKTVLGV